MMHQAHNVARQASIQQPRNCWALIVAAGVGTRLPGMKPKQYRVIKGQAVLQHTLNVWLAINPIQTVLLVISPNDAYFSMLSAKVKTHKKLHVARIGGETRSHSVLNGLHYLAELGAQPEDWVLVHDGVRCGITTQAIKSLIQHCQYDHVGGILALPLTDTLKYADQARIDKTLPRLHCWLAQTPQMFRLQTLTHAIESAHAVAREISDEASAIEALGLHPLLVRGQLRNLKITYPDDLKLMQTLL